MRKILFPMVTIALLVLDIVPAHAATVQIECEASHFAPDDPIVFPGRPGAAHMHEFFGNRSTDADSTYRSMLDKRTTCPFRGDTAAYWAPTLLDENGQRIPARRMTVYYRDRPVESADVVPFPKNFRMIAGAPTRAVWGYNCDGLELSRSVRIDCSGESEGHTYVRATVIFPNCGKLDADGKVVKDSSDHRRHVAYPVSAREGCPDSHPVQLPHVKMNVRYDVSNCIREGCQLSSDMAAGCDTGCSLHADLWNTWKQSALVNLVETRLNG